MPRPPHLLIGVRPCCVQTGSSGSGPDGSRAGDDGNGSAATTAGILTAVVVVVVVVAVGAGWCHRASTKPEMGISSATAPGVSGSAVDTSSREDNNAPAPSPMTPNPAFRGPDDAIEIPAAVYEDPNAESECGRTPPPQCTPNKQHTHSNTHTATHTHTQQHTIHTQRTTAL